MNTATTNLASAEVVHEAIDERQYVRTKIPARVTLIGAGQPIECEIEDISLGGIGLRCSQPLKPGSLLGVSIHLQLGKVALNIDARIKVVNQVGQQIGAQFIELDSQKRDILRYLISAYMAGEIADVNGLLHVMQRENYIKQRKQKNNSTRGAGERLKAFGGSLLFLLAGLLIAGLLLYKLYLFFFHVPASQALVSADAYVISMPENGYVKFMIDRSKPRVSVGEPIATVSTQLTASFNTPSDLEALSNLSPNDLQAVLGRALIETVISSPCDCYVYFPNKRMDSYAYKYDELVHLIPANEDIFVKASVPFAKLKDINRVDSIALGVPGIDEPIAGRILNQALDSATQSLVLTIKPERKLPMTAYQQPVAVDMFLDFPFHGTL